MTATADDFTASTDYHLRTPAGTWGIPSSVSGLHFQPLLPNDYPFLYTLAVMEEGAYRWRFRDIRPSYEDFIRTLYNGVLAQFLVVETGAKRPAGLVVAYQADFKNRHAYVAMQAVPALRGRGATLKAGDAFIEWLFQGFGFEKLYAELPGFNYGSFASGIGKVVREEGRLVNHEYSGGRWWDLHLLAIHRSDWMNRPKGPANPVHDPSSNGSGLRFEEFCAIISDELGLDSKNLAPSTRLIEDLGMDSISHFELLLILEDLGASITTETVARMASLADVHFLYLQHRQPLHEK